jgi:hypothetical protein
MRVLGTFRDVDDPDQFVWLRAFPDLATRLAGLSGFYGGPIWRRHRDAANATMVDSDDVLLLEHVTGELPTTERPAVGGERVGPSRVLAVVRIHRSDVEPDLGPVPRLLGAPVAVLRTSGPANNFPALPVRSDRAVVWLARFADADVAGGGAEGARRGGSRTAGARAGADGTVGIPVNCGRKNSRRPRRMISAGPPTCVRPKGFEPLTF